MELTKEQENWCRQALLRLRNKKESDARKEYEKLNNLEDAIKSAAAAVNWKIDPNVNASFIKSINSTVICSAQPRLSIFWDMVVFYKCKIIVKLTEDSPQEYFPDLGEKKMYGSTSVTNISERVPPSKSGVSKRTLLVESGEEAMKVELYQYPWSDFGVPKSVEPVLEIFEQLYKLGSSDVYIVHCRAGIGRSGTFVVIDHILRRILLGGDVSGTTDVEGVVRELRDCRAGLVETEDQYWFCFRAVIAELERLLESARSAADEKQYALELNDIV